MGNVRILDHTGDIGIEVEDATLEGIFAASARAMFDIMADVSRVDPRCKEEIVLDAPGWDLLLREFLAEMLFRFFSEGMIFSEFCVTFEGERLRARVRGEPFDPERHGMKTELKAVTYHQLEVRRTDRGWFARIIFDV